MAYQFDLPDIGEGLAEATIVRWLVPVGGTVGMDEPVVELETDKTVLEIPSPRAGVVLHHGAPEGATIPVGSLLVVIGEPGEQWSPTASDEAEPHRAASESAAASGAAPIVGTLEEAGEGPESDGVNALPVVRRMAAQAGVDLASVRGTGPGGRITREDVEAAAGGGPVDRVRLSPTRLAIARNVARAWKEIPHVTTYATADASGILAERSRRTADDGPMPLEAILIDAIVPVLAEHPEFNASLDGEHALLRRHYDIGFAVDTPEGLLVAVVRDAPSLRIDEVAAEVTRLAAAARDRTITLEEIRGATFTISNIGAVGGGFGTPIIPYGTTAILSVGRAEPAPVVHGDEIVIGRRMPLSLSYDHRLIDGALGRRFLSALVEAIEGRS